MTRQPGTPTDTLGARVRALRDERGMTQEQLATRLGHDQTFVSRLELGKNTVTFDELGEIAAVFEMSVVDLLERE